MNNYYVYLYLDPRKPGDYQYGSYYFNFEPFYAGKGTGGRFRCHLTEAYNNTERGKNPHKCNRIRKIKEETGNDPIIIQIHTDMTHEEACDKERQIIKAIGRTYDGKGPLTNLTLGGHGGRAGMKQTKYQKAAVMKALKGKPKTKEHIEAMREGNVTKRKSYIITDPEGNEYKIDNLSKLCRERNLNYKELLKVSARTPETKHIHRATQWKGWKCRKAEVDPTQDI